MQIVIDISKDRYDEIMSMDWVNCRLFFDEELRAIHDGKELEQESCENCCNCNQIEKAKLCQKSYLAGMEHKQEPCDDCVSRQAALEVIKKCHCEEWVKADIGAPIEALQSVTPQQKMGRWTHDGSHWENRFICSECGYKLFDEQTNYCPNCGCAMKGELE